MGLSCRRVNERRNRPPIVANQIGALPGWRPGWYSGGRILALHFASAEPLPDVQSPF